MVNNAMNYWVLGLLSFLMTAYSWNPNLNIPGGPFNNNNNNRVNNPQENIENMQSLPVSDMSSSEAESSLKAVMTPMMDRKKAIAYCAGILGTATSLGGNPTPAIAAEPIPTRIELTVDTEYLLRCLDFFNGDLNMAIATIARSRKDSEIKVDPPREDLATVLKAIYKNKSPEQLTGEQFWLPATIVPYQENLWAESWNDKKFRVVTKTENGIETAFSFNIAQAALAGLGTVASTYPASYAYYDYQKKESARKSAEKRAKLAAKNAAKKAAKAKAAAAAKKKDKKGDKVKGAPSKKKAAKKGSGDKNGPVASKEGPAAEAKKKKDKVKGKPSTVKLSVGEDGELYVTKPRKIPKKDPSSPSIVGIDIPNVVEKEAKVVEKATQIPPPPPQPEVAAVGATTASSAGGGSPNKQIDPYAAAYAAAAAAPPKSPPVETAASTASDASTPAVAPPVQSSPADDYSASFAESLRQMTRQ